MISNVPSQKFFKGFFRSPDRLATYNLRNLTNDDITHTPLVVLMMRKFPTNHNQATGAPVKITKISPDVHISRLDFDNAEWCWKSCRMKLNYSKQKYDELHNTTRQPNAPKQRYKYSQPPQSQQKQDTSKMFIATADPSGIPQPDGHIEVPPGNIRTVLNNPRPGSARLSRPSTAQSAQTAQLAQPKKRMKSTSRYDPCQMPAPPSVRSSTPTTPPIRLLTTPHRRRTSTPFGHAVTQPINKNLRYVASPLSRRDSIVGSDSESDCSTTSSSSSRKLKEIARTGSNLAQAPMRIGTAVWKRVRAGKAEEEWDGEVYYDMHGRAWTEDVAKASEAELKK